MAGDSTVYHSVWTADRQIKQVIVQILLPSVCMAGTGFYVAKSEICRSPLQDNFCVFLPKRQTTEFRAVCSDFKKMQIIYVLKRRSDKFPLGHIDQPGI